MGISDKQRIVWLDEPKTINGLELHPIPMSRYSEWMMHKRALTLRQSTLPAAFAIMPYLSALQAMDFQYKTSFVYSTIQILAMSTQKTPECFQLHVQADDHSKLAHILYNDGNTCFRITPKDYPAIRCAIAELNGEELPDEGDNPELIEAENDIREANAAVKLDMDANTMVASVAFQYRKRKHELMEWSIREFEEARRSIERDKSHMICAIAEKTPMFKWVKGNPCPSWCFDKLKEGSIALESMGDFSRRTGVGGGSMPIQSN